MIVILGNLEEIQEFHVFRKASATGRVGRSDTKLVWRELITMTRVTGCI